METCEGRALEVAKAVLPSRSPPGHAHILHRFWCKMCPVRPALWAHHLQATQAGRLSRVETDYGLFACTRSVGRQKMHGRIRSVRCAFRAAKQPQQLASITFCLPQPSVAKQGGLRGSFGLRNFEMLPLRVFIFYKISFSLLYKAKPNLLQSAFIRKVQ